MSLNKSKALRTAEKYVLQGKIPAAIDEYRKVVDADPTDLTTINTLGDLYVRAGKIQDAINNFSRIAESYRESGFTLKAIAMLKKISKLDPTNVETSMKLANLYSQQGLLVEARQQYLQVADAYARAGQTRKALEAYQKIADLDPSNTSVRIKLGEIYSREGMLEQAHESFIIAGAEFLRKGDTEQALNANLKAISINPESRQGLTAIASIYTEQGQADRAINVLCDAFERNPGDVELLTILGRTYLSAGLMDDAERTFLSLVELDRSRYHYLLEVARRFLQLGDLDRAAEQIDGCLDVLIAKREEDKAIDFLRRVLDRDMNHIGSLKRLSQIFLRIREDHNLIATLNSLAEAAMRKGVDDEAIAALKELVRLEPDEPMHLQRLYTLGVRDIAEPDAPDVVRATGPLDFESAVYDDAFVIRQISEAEILAGHGQVDHAVQILKEILNHAPENVQVHLKLKDIYLRAAKMDKAASECVELARIHEARGESARASDYIAEAHQLNPSIAAAAKEIAGETGDSWLNVGGQPFGFETTGSAPPNGNGGFEIQESPSGFDLSKYNTSALSDQPGFVTISEEAATPGSNPAKDNVASKKPMPDGTRAIRFSDMLVGAPGEARQQKSEPDPISRVLRDELEGIDFYIAQGYFDIARDTLDRLLKEHGHHPEILVRYQKLGVSFDSAAASEHEYVEIAESYTAQPEPGSVSPSNIVKNGDQSGREIDLGAGVQFQGNAPEPAGDFTFTVPRSPQESEHQNVTPFLVHKESGMLNKDLLVQFNTGDLLSNTAFDPERLPTGILIPPDKERVGTAELIEGIVSDMDSSLEGMQEQQEVSAVEAEPVATVSSQVMAPVGIETPESRGAAAGGDAQKVLDTTTELQKIFEEVKETTGDLNRAIDYETHYSLGLAYKDMELLDDAIEQFQMAFKMADPEGAEENYIQCCHMLGVCFKRKSMTKVAVMWFHRGLNIPNRSEDEYQALRYEIGLCYEEIGEIDKAIDMLMQVYGIDLNYRQVGKKIKELQALKKA